MAHGYAPTKDDVLVRLRRIEGQVRGLQRLVDEETYCIDVLTQISSVTKALQGVGVGLLDDHISHCVREAVQQGDEAGDEKIEGVCGLNRRLLMAWPPAIAIPSSPGAGLRLGRWWAAASVARSRLPGGAMRRRAPPQTPRYVTGDGTSWPSSANRASGTSAEQ